MLRSLLFGLSAADLAAYAGVALLLIVVALLSCRIRARRATDRNDDQSLDSGGWVAVHSAGFTGPAPGFLGAPGRAPAR